MEQFKILNKIGEGAYSTVYTVKRIEDDKIYALKKVKIKKLSKKEQTNALNEVRILASVNSPYVIGYRESFIDEIEQTLCIIMEYADDGDLYQKIKLYINNKTYFMEHDIWRIFIQITKGLHDLHEYNILHRDLKSANVFLFKDGSAKLGDLNVSKITTRGLGYTQTGTPYYASPEVWKDKPYNSKSDIWSLGCVFYELIMLTTPFKAKSMKDLFEKVKKGEYPPIPKMFSPKFQIVIDRILKVRPEERPDAGDILNMPEIQDKIEELGIFNKNKENIKKNKDNNNFESLFAKKIKLKANQSKKIRRKNAFLNVNKSVELNNKMNSNLAKKYQIFSIYKHNISYFQEKYKQKKKIVLNTIKYPKQLKDLNNKLPGLRYDDNKSNENNKNKISKIEPKLLFPVHKLLPKIYLNKLVEDKKKENNEEVKNENNDLNNSENTKLNNSNRITPIDKCFIMNTLHQQINKKKVFDSKGKIDIIIKE